MPLSDVYFDVPLFWQAIRETKPPNVWREVSASAPRLRSGRSVLWRMQRGLAYIFAKPRRALPPSWLGPTARRKLHFVLESEQRSNSISVRKGATLVQPAAVVAPGLPYGALDREHLTASLLALARRVGVDNVTMRVLATEAHTSASSVYYHVKNKAEMLDLLIEEVVSSITVPTAGSWEEKLVALYHNAWRVLVDVPGIAALLQQRPHTAAAADMDRQTRKILHQSGLPAEEIQAAHALLYIQLLGAVALEHARANPSMGPALTAPRMEPIFTYGLQVILAGLAYRANGRRKKTTLKARQRSDVALTRKEPGDY